MGIQKYFDEVGRIVVPCTMKKKLGLENGDAVDIELQDNKIIITKPDTVDYKAIVDKAIEYMKAIFMNCIDNDKRYFEDPYIQRIYEILKGE